MTIITATELHHHFGKYLKLVQAGEEVAIMKNGKIAARLVPHEKTVSLLTDTLTGVLRGNYDNKAVTAEKMEQTEYTD